MRIYEYAKQRDVLIQDVLDALRKDKGDSAARSHMATVSAEEIAELDAFFSKKSNAAGTLLVKNLGDEEACDVAVCNKEGRDKVEAVQSTDLGVLTGVRDVRPVARQSIAPEKVLRLEPMSVAEFAATSGRLVSDVILALLRKGIVANKNQTLSPDAVRAAAEQMGLRLEVALRDEKEAASTEGRVSTRIAGGASAEKRESRLPVVVVVGHVDHGKTTLLDYIRNTRVASREKGGITQHVGAYEAKTQFGSLVFLDTPGHEAFVRMRERGTRLADVAILVVAADDGVMPQTIEAIRQIRQANIPIVVAINKIDKASPVAIEAVRRGLAQHGLVPEAWGGQTVCVPVSAKTGQGVDELLDVVLLQAGLLELDAPIDVPARGHVLEAKMERGRGVVGTVLCREGVLSVGDYFVAGSVVGKVTSMVDSHGKRVQSCRPSQPVVVAGFEDMPAAGDSFEVVSVADFRKIKQGHERIDRAAGARMAGGVQVSADRVHRGDKKHQAMPIVIKADNDSSREAFLGAVEKINKNAFRPLHVVFSGIGNISEGDIQFAADTGATIYGLHVKPEAGASVLALKLGIAIQLFDIIYKLIDELKAKVEKDRPVELVRKKIGEALVLKVFDIKNLGIIAGARIRNGYIAKDAPVKVWRGSKMVGEGVIKSLQREKRSIKEAQAGFECAFAVNGFEDWMQDDRVECFKDVPRE